jgi:hypothetical protein
MIEQSLLHHAAFVHIYAILHDFTNTTYSAVKRAISKALRQDLAQSWFLKNKILWLPSN